jgi:hypothetical protein
MAGGLHRRGGETGGDDLEERRRRGRELQRRLPRPRHPRRRSGPAGDIVEVGCCLSELAEWCAAVVVATTGAALLARAARRRR